MDEWIKKKDVLHRCVRTHTHTHTHTQILFGNEKEGKPVICNNMNKTGGH